LKLKKSGALIATVLLIILIFASIMIWHDKSPGRVSEEDNFLSMRGLIDQVPEIHGLFAQMDLNQPSAFYVVGTHSGTTWPTRITWACYIDPIASHLEFRRGGKSLDEDVIVYRYRSQEDFIRLLEEQEIMSKGSLSGLNMKRWVVIPVSPTDASLKLFFSVILIFLAVAIATIMKNKSY
jgi:hypothetical protein